MEVLIKEKITDKLHTAQLPKMAPAILDNCSPFFLIFFIGKPSAQNGGDFK